MRQTDGQTNRRTGSCCCCCRAVCQPRPHPRRVHKIDFQVQLRVSFFNDCNLLHASLTTTNHTDTQLKGQLAYLQRSNDGDKVNVTEPPLLLYCGRIVSFKSLYSLYRLIHSFNIILPYDDLRQYSHLVERSSRCAIKGAIYSIS